MWRRLTSRPAWGVVAYTAMSLLLVWHTLAMMIASAPESDITAAARVLLNPYLTLFRLNNRWGFFSPAVDLGVQFRYVVEDAAGQRHTFVPADKLSRFHPTSIWFRDRYRAIMASFETHSEAAAAEFCREHAAQQPVSITFLEIEQKHFAAEDRLSGKRPLDPEFVSEHTLGTIKCPAQ
jgi:hypothetical protein